MSPIEHRFVHAGGLRHHVAVCGEGPVVLLLHGFPEGWYSWRHQLRALAAAGYRAIAPDARGYGETDAPRDIAAYDTRAHAGDAIGILDAIGVEQALVVGHDWGAVTAWRCALDHPTRVAAVAALSAPLGSRLPVPPTAFFRKRFEGEFFYILYFQEPGVAEAELEADVHDTLRRFYFAASGEGQVGSGLVGKPAGARLLDGMLDPPSLPAWLDAADLDVCAGAFARSGFRGPLNRYRNMDRDWEALAGDDARVSAPALFVTGARDLGHVFDPGAIDRMRPRVPALRDPVILPGAGHWVQQERPAETSAALLRFFDEARRPAR